MRTIAELASLIDRRVRFTLTTEEKHYIANAWARLTNTKMSNCPDCYGRAIKKLNQIGIKEVVEPTPILVKDKLVVNDEPTKPLEDYSTGAGWYRFPDGHKVRGKDNAQKYLDENITRV
jgi:hypothetical protein